MEVEEPAPNVSAEVRQRRQGGEIGLGLRIALRGLALVVIPVRQRRFRAPDGLTKLELRLREL